MNNVILILTGTLMHATPLLFAALGGVISESSGVMNIALEGVMTFGAFTGAAVAYASNNSWLGFFMAGLAGALLISLHAIASITFRADQTISGTAINFLGPGISLLLAKKMFNGSALSPTAPKLPILLTKSLTEKWRGTPLENLNISVGVVIAFALVLLIWFLFYRTKWGLRILATGQHPAAVDTLGVNVYVMRYICVISSGVLAGFGGAFMSLSVTSSFSPSTVCGQGFIALAAVIFGKWTPHGVMLSCLLFGFAKECTTILGGEGAFIPPVLLEMFPYVLTILVLVLFVGKSSVPKANGVPYLRGAR